MIGDTPYPFAVGFYRDQVFHDLRWDYRTHPVNFDTDVDLADSPQNLPINATNADISRFIHGGGKLLLMGGWNDHTLGPGTAFTTTKASSRSWARARRAALCGCSWCPAWTTVWGTATDRTRSSRQTIPSNSIRLPR